MKKKFRIRPFENKTLSWWYNRKTQIDMNPEYQRRGRLWSHTDKAYLIDSIINGYDIPKIYIADFAWGDSKLNKKKLPYAIIDGKQRFEAIFDFFNGTIVLNDDFVYADNPNLKLGGLGYKDLANNYPKISDEFSDYNLSVIGVYAESDEPINELFVRLNRSKPLTGAEIRNAMSGPVPGIIRQISKHEFFEKYLSFSVRRGQDQNAAAKILLFEHLQNFSNTTKNVLDRFVSNVRNEQRNLIELSGRHVLDNLDNMCTIFLPKDNLLNSAGILPVYYWLVRSLKENDFAIVREFLKDFNQKRRDNRQLIRNNTANQNIDYILVDFDNYNRSTNDEASHRERFNILMSKFTIFRKK